MAAPGKAFPTYAAGYPGSILYCQEECAVHYQGALRSAGTETFPAAVFSGQTVETYIGFISDNGRYVASSIYTGQVNLVP